MAWPSPEFPPASGSFRSTHYDRVIALWAALRQRNVIVNDTTEWPMGQEPWSTPGQSGVINALTTSGVNIRITDIGTSPDFNPDWVDSTGSPIKRWTSFAGTWYGVDIRPAPDAYRIVIYPPDTGSPLATAMGDPQWGATFDIVDNGENWIEFFNDGTLFLNGKTTSSYAGYRYQIIRDGGGDRQGMGWVDRFPWHPNDSETFLGFSTASTTTSLTDDRAGADDRFKCPVDFSTYVGYDVVFRCADAVWRRRTIASVSHDVSTTGINQNKLTFSSSVSAPIVGEGYWIVASGKFWLPRNKGELVRYSSRRGKFWSWSGSSRPWLAGAAWNDTRSAAYVSHEPNTDVYSGTPIPVEGVQVDPGPPEKIVQTFDNDGKTSDYDETLPEGQTGRLFNRWMFRTNRGLQLATEFMFGAAPWVEAKDYAGQTAIPDWTKPSWFKKAIAANTRTTTITATTDRSGGVGTISISMPNKTAGEPYTSLPCIFTLYDTNGDVRYNSQGTVTATTLTDAGTQGFRDHLPPPDDDGITDVGLTVIIAFCGDSGGDVHTTYDNGSWTRKHARLVRYIYPRTVFIPDDDGDGPVDPPTSSFPGNFVKTTPSTNYAEYSKHGEIDDSGHALITGEYAVYVGDNWEDPFPPGFTDSADPLLPYYGAAYQGLPNVQPTSAWPRWEGAARTGTATSAGVWFIEDNAQMWWGSSSPSITHSGTATGGGTGTLTDAGGNGFWVTPDRLVGLVLEVETNPSGLPGVYELAPIISQDTSTKTVTTLYPFTAGTSGKAYRIREPGSLSVGGNILNLWEGRQVKVTHGTTVKTATILYSDDTRLYFSTAGWSFVPTAGDSYEIVQREPGSVWKRDLTDVNRIPSNWVGPQVPGTKPTICTSFGRYRKRDYVGLHFWDEVYQAIDAMRWIKHGMGWNGKGETGLSWDPGTDVGLTSTVANSAAYTTDFTTRTDASKSLWEGGNPSLGTFGDTISPRFSTHAQTDRPYPFGEGSDFELFVDIHTSLRSYGKASGFPTQKLNFDCDFFACARCDGGDAIPVDHTIVNTGSGNAARIFNAFGSGFTYAQFKKIETISTGWPERLTTVLVGPSPLDGPPFWTKPLDPTLYDIPLGASEETNTANTGFVVNQQVTILRFDVGGGLTYVS